MPAHIMLILQLVDLIQLASGMELIVSKKLVKKLRLRTLALPKVNADGLTQLVPSIHAIQTLVRIHVEQLLVVNGQELNVTLMNAKSILILQLALLMLHASGTIQIAFSILAHPMLPIQFVKQMPNAIGQEQPVQLTFVTKTQIQRPVDLKHLACGQGPNATPILAPPMQTIQLAHLIHNANGTELAVKSLALRDHPQLSVTSIQNVSGPTTLVPPILAKL